MKKLIYTANFLAILSVVVLTGCKKDKEAFPTAPTSNGTTSDFTFMPASFPAILDADGMLIAVQAHNYYTVTVSPFEKDYEYGMAQFTNTSGNFSTLTDADSVLVNSTNCAKSSLFSYLSNITTYSLNFSNPVSWRVKGAGSVPPISYTVSTNNPDYTYFAHSGASANTWKDTWVPVYPKTLTVITRKPTTGITPPSPPTPTHMDSVLWYGISSPQPNHTDSTRWINDSSTFKSALDSYNKTKAQHIADSTYNETPYTSIPLKVLGVNYLSNTDTVFVIFDDAVGFNYVRKAPATDTAIYFKPNNFLGMPTYLPKNFTMQINLIKYNMSIIAGKKYYFLRMGSYIKYWKAS